MPYTLRAIRACVPDRWRGGRATGRRSPAGPPARDSRCHAGLPGASTTLRMRELLATVPRTWPTVTWDVSPDSPLMRKVSLRMLGRAGSSALLISPTRAPMSGAAARALAVSDARTNEAATITRMENLLRPRQHVVGQGRSRAVGRSRRGADEI